jgi:hypothetical protein
MPPVSEQQLLALSVNGDGHAVDADTRCVSDLGASDNIRITILTVNIVENTTQLNYTYQEALPPTSIEVQPMPIGMFEALVLRPSAATRSLNNTALGLKFTTFCSTEGCWSTDEWNRQWSRWV